jgi:SAM-dependent methyltransferase
MTTDDRRWTTDDGRRTTDDGRRTMAAEGEGTAARQSSVVGGRSSPAAADEPSSQAEDAARQSSVVGGRSSPAAEGEASPFDAMASGYDAGFTHSLVGRLMREAVWSRLDAAFGPGDRVLELSCGTGEDAVHLARRGVRVLATDASAGMLAVARQKVAAAGLAELVEVAWLDLARLTQSHNQGAIPAPRLPLSPPFDGALSNFGGLNCVADQRGVARALAGLLRPGARVLLCVMGPVVPWEWGWYLARGEAQKAVRRLRPGGVAWRGLQIVYPSVGALRAAYAPWFSCRRVSALGALLPPSYAEGWAREHPGLLWALGRVERAFETMPPLPQLADHYLIELERKEK